VGDVGGDVETNSTWLGDGRDGFGTEGVEGVDTVAEVPGSAKMLIVMWTRGLIVGEFCCESRLVIFRCTPLPPLVLLTPLVRRLAPEVWRSVEVVVAASRQQKSVKDNRKSAGSKLP
jgi:hypothetical protein